MMRLLSLSEFVPKDFWGLSYFRPIQSTPSAPTSFDSDIKADQEIRLFTFERSPAEDIVISLEKVLISNPPPFKCLSYYWGDSTDTCQIYCNGRSLSVTKNLWKALRRIRRRDKSKRTKFWADQICINQLRDEEKIPQIQMMSEIFPSSERVICWLGEEDAHTVEAITAIREWDKATDDFNLKQKLNESWSSGGLTSTTAAQREALKSLLSRPWFSRAWTLQEIFVPREKSPDVICGSHCITWDQLCRAFFTLCSTLGFHDRIEALGRDVRLALPMFEVYHQRDEGTLRLSTLLIIALQRAASREQDRIFGVLAIMKHEKFSYPEADYDMPLIEVYERYTRAIIEQEDNLDVLTGEPEDHDQCTTMTAPSWILLPEKYGMETSSVLRRIKKSNYPHGGATGQTTSLQPPEAERSSNRLTLYGIHSDQIAYVHDLRLFLEILPQHPWKWQDILDGAGHFARTLGLPTAYEPTNEPIETAILKTMLLDDFYVGCPNHSGDYGAEINTLYARFCREHPSADFIFESLEVTPDAENSGESMSNAEKLYILARNNFHFDSGKRDAGHAGPSRSPFRAERSGYLAVLDWLDGALSGHIREQLEFNPLYYALAVSRNGDIALVYRTAKVGDDVCLLMGGFLPYILRKEADCTSYRLIGDAYVHGCLDGKGGRECDARFEAFRKRGDGDALEAICLV